jgi:hypothetical protein
MYTGLRARPQNHGVSETFCQFIFVLSFYLTARQKRLAQDVPPQHFRTLTLQVDAFRV